MKKGFYLLLITAVLLTRCGQKPNLEELICINIEAQGGKCYLFADTTGAVIVKPHEGECWNFHCYRAAVKHHGKWGYIDNYGKVVIPCKYEMVNHFHNGYAFVQNDAMLFGLIDHNGKEVLPHKYKSIRGIFQHGLMAVCNTSDRWGCINEQGEEVIPCEYKQLEILSNGNVYVKTAKEKENIITPDGKFISLPNHKAWGDITNELIIVINDSNLYGVINENGDEIVPCIYKRIYNYQDNMARVTTTDNRVGWLTTEGKEIIAEGHINNFSDGMASVYDTNGQYGFYNKDGKLAIPCQYRRVSDFSNGFAAVQLPNENTYGYINKRGEKVIPARYYRAAPFNHGVARVEQKDSWFYIDTIGNRVDSVFYPFRYIDIDDCMPDLEHVSLSRSGESTAAGQPVGLRNSQGETVVPCRYHHISKHPHWIEAVATNGKTFIYSPTGNLYFKY